MMAKCEEFLHRKAVLQRLAVPIRLLVPPFVDSLSLPSLHRLLPTVYRLTAWKAVSRLLSREQVFRPDLDSCLSACQPQRAVKGGQEDRQGQAFLP
jgi:hypothetical protein